MKNSISNYIEINKAAKKGIYKEVKKSDLTEHSVCVIKTISLGVVHGFIEALR